MGLNERRTFSCVHHAVGSLQACGSPTPLFIYAEELGELGVCPEHAGEVMAALQLIGRDGQLFCWTSKMVERWGPQPINVNEVQH